MRRYFAGLAIVFVLVVLLIILVSGSGTKQKPSTAVQLPNYASSNTAAIFTIIGPTSAPQNHSQIVITVNNATATLQVYQGYQGTIVHAVTFPNDENSFSAFLYALQQAGYTLGDTSSKLQNYQGYCALGDTYVMELQQNGKDIQRFWRTNCSGQPYTFKGNFSQVFSLFRMQIPNYSSHIGNANL